MRIRRLAVAVLLAFGMLGAGAAWACLVWTPVEGTIQSATVIDPGEVSIDDQGVVSGRGSVTEEALVGDLTGTLYVRGNMDLNTVTGAGYLWGTLRFTGTVGDDDDVGSYVGIWGGPIESFALDVDWWMVGIGAFSGTWLRVENTGYVTPPGTPFVPQPYEGYVIARD